MTSTHVDIKYTKLFINNEFVDSVSKKTFPVVNPTTGKTIVEVQEGDKADIDLAVAAAKAAFARGSKWKTMNPSDRGLIINKFADLLESHKEEIVKLEVLESGKIISYAREVTGASIALFRYYAGFCDKIHGNTIPSDGPVFSLTLKEPIGVVGQIIPWNFPAMMLSWKWGPALATGCTIVLKPAEETPLTALYIAALSKEAGFPDGVINVIPGFGPTAGAALTAHHDVRKIAFTGSTEVGHIIMESAAKSNLKKVTLELGGKSPLVVFDDFDVDEAVQIAAVAIFTNQGQSCSAGSRTYVQSGIYDKFVQKAVQRAKSIKIGDPFVAGVDHGPQINETSMNKILNLIESGKKQGAVLETGGNRIGTEGYFVEPTVFSNVKDDMRIAKEEIFGPVQTILKFDTLEEVIERANNTNYGLAAGVITNNISTALVFAQSVEAGSVWINCYDETQSSQAPFGGYKESGMGRDLGADSIDDYVQTKTVTIKMPYRI